MTKLLTNNYKLNALLQIEESLSESANNSYYIYVADHVAHIDDDLETPEESTREVFIDQYRKMIFGKRVTPNDVALMIRNVEYQANHVYEMYDDTVELEGKNYYVIVDEGSQYHIYKCLDNNRGAMSTVQPTYAYAAAATNGIFRTLADGYTWKYMGMVSDADVNYFGTQFYRPVRQDANIAASARRGAIDVIKVDGQGEGYHNYTAGVFNVGDMRVNGNPLMYKIANASISHANDFYNDCYLYISTGPGAGQYRAITDYISNANGNFVVLDRAFTITPTNGVLYEVNPIVKISGSGDKLANAFARAIVDPLKSNCIARVEMLNNGLNYEYAEAKVMCSNVVGMYSNAEVRPIYSPLGGHGANVYAELGVKALVMTAEFENTEGNTITVDNVYQTIGLLKDPKFANVNIELSNTYSTFTEGEDLYAFTKYPVHKSAVVSTGDNVISTGLITVTAATIANPGTGYMPEDIVYVDGTGTDVLAPASLKILSVEVKSATVNTAGNDQYSNGDIVVLEDLVSEEAPTFVVTTNEDGNPVSVAVNGRGLYESPLSTTGLTTTNETNGDASGLTLDIQTQAVSVEIFDGGAFAGLPDDVFENHVTSNVLDDGVDLTVSLTMTPSGEGSLQEQFTPGEFVYIIGYGSAEDDNVVGRQLSIVSTIPSQTQMELSTNVLFTSSNVTIHKANILASGEIITVPNTTHIRVDGIRDNIGNGTAIAGLASGAEATVNTIYRNDVAKSFNTFMQLYKYDVSMISGEFLPNEKLFQGGALANSSANAVLHSVVSDAGTTLIYTSEQIGEFFSNNSIKGANSGALATLNTKWSPELVFGSGDVLYVENLEPIGRADDQTEQFKLVFELFEHTKR